MENETLLPLVREFTAEERLFFANQHSEKLQKQLDSANLKIKTLREYYHGQEDELKAAKRELNTLKNHVEQNGMITPGAYQQALRAKEIAEEELHHVSRELNRLKKEMFTEGFKQLKHI